MIRIALLNCHISRRAIFYKKGGMLYMSKRIISIVLVVFMALSLFAFVGCSNREETQQRISDLQQQITELQSLLQQQTALLAELQSANSEMTDQITELTNSQTATIAQITELQEQLLMRETKLTV